MVQTNEFPEIKLLAQIPINTVPHIEDNIADFGFADCYLDQNSKKILAIESITGISTDNNLYVVESQSFANVASGQETPLVSKVFIGSENVETIGRLNSMAYNLETGMTAVGTSRGKVHLINNDLSTQLLIFKGDEFSPDGGLNRILDIEFDISNGTLVVASRSGQLGIVNISTKQSQELACAKAGRALTTIEFESYFGQSANYERHLELCSFNNQASIIN